MGPEIDFMPTATITASTSTVAAAQAGGACCRGPDERSPTFCTVLASGRRL
jgi:hypothetical protein